MSKLKITAPQSSLHHHLLCFIITFSLQPIAVWQQDCPINEEIYTHSFRPFL